MKITRSQRTKHIRLTLISLVIILIFVLVYTLSKSAAVSTYSDVSKMITDFGQKYNPDTEKNDHSSSVLKANSQNVKDTKGNDSKHEVLGNLQSDSTGQVTSQNPGNYLGEIEQMSPEELERAKTIMEEPKEGEETTTKLGVPDPNNSKFPPVTKNKPELPQIPLVGTKDKLKRFKFRIYSHNVKNGGYHSLVPGEQQWSDRLIPLVASIKFNTFPDNSIVTLQEVYKFQMLDILKELNRHEPGKWDYYGKGRIDGEEIGEFVPIIWQPTEWELVYSDTMWLNDKDPRTSFEGWDAVYARIVSYVTLRHKATDNYINVFNTHFDHIGQEAQVGSAKLIIDTMKELNLWPSFLSGDLNIEPNLDPYKVLNNYLLNTANLATPFNKFGHFKSTVTGFEGEVLLDGGQNIDYIFAPKYTLKMDSDENTKGAGELTTDISLKLYQLGMLHSKFNGKYISDHRPLVADFIMN